jgi:hypothetical protein
MSHNAAELLGSPQIAGVTVAAVGAARATAVRQGAAAGSPVATGIAAKIVDPKGERVQTPKFGVGFLAITSSELALLGLKSGKLTLKLSEVIARVPRGDVTGAELQGRGAVGLLTISFRGGDAWEVEVAKVHQRAARKLIEALTANPAAA